MKKMLALALAALLCMAAAVCAADVCDHARTREYNQLENLQYTEITDRRHTEVGELYHVVECEDCGGILESVLIDESYTQTTRHMFDDGVCSFCGYESACDHARTATNRYFTMLTPVDSDVYTHSVTGTIVEFVSCRICGAVLERDITEFTEPVRLKHGYGSVCYVCGYEQEGAQDDAECSHPSTEELIYFDEGELTGETSAEGHVYLAEELFKEIYCSECYETIELVTLGENVEFTEEHVYIGDFCSLCGYAPDCEHAGELTQKTSYGLVHNPVIEGDTHSFLGDVITYLICPDCGLTVDEVYEKDVQVSGEAHDFVDGVCAVCRVTEA